MAAGARKGPPGLETEKPPPRAWALLAGAILLAAVGSVVILMQLFSSAGDGGWLAAGAVLGVGGIAGLVVFFDKWGNL